ncbi:hypothetical protein AVEN_55883-1 [Araneus ventricosus]|uniref:Uncharacterized protein n=1 Tax=Araneus ventricosus TaxID=182803 RepID=A0A4Y2S3J8_ARAVE|nr:hypothetical protein AVEN_55883-1 [Araneus ventricosus]
MARSPTKGIQRLCANGIQRRQCHVQFAGKQVPLTQVADIATSDRGRSNRRVVFCEWTLKMRENVSGQSWNVRIISFYSVNAGKKFYTVYNCLSNVNQYSSELKSRLNVSGVFLAYKLCMTTIVP